MSSSRDYYKSSRDALPPIRDVLGDHLDLPARRDNTYSFDAVNRALPDTSSSRSRSPWPQSSGPTLPPIHHSRSQGYTPSGPSTPLYTSSRTHSHSQHPPSSHSHSTHSTHAPSHHPADSHPAPGPAPYSFDVFRPSSAGLVHASSASRSQGILRTTRADAGRKSRRADDDADADVDDGYKKYACKDCGKRFGRPSSLKAHEVVHSDEKPFECCHPGCGKTFTVPSNMRRHYRKMHETQTPGSVSGDEEDEYYGSGSTSGGRGHGDDSHRPSSFSASASGSGSRNYYTSSRR